MDLDDVRRKLRTAISSGLGVTLTHEETVQAAGAVHFACENGVKECIFEIKEASGESLFDAPPEVKAAAREAIAAGNIVISDEMKAELAKNGISVDDIAAAIMKETGGTN